MIRRLGDDLLRDIRSASTRSSEVNMGVVNSGRNSRYVPRQEKAEEIRNLVTQTNAMVAELEEDGYAVEFKGVGSRLIRGMIRDVSITKHIRI